MESLVKQIRARFPYAGEGNKEAGSSRERKIPLQKTQAFKGERKGLSWLRRQFSGGMSRGFDFDNDSEYATAVAAAAYAINSLEETRIPDQKKKSEGPKPAPTRAMSKKEDTTSALPDPGRASRQFSGQASLRISEGTEKREPTKAAEKTAPPPPPPPPPPPSLPKTPTAKPPAAASSFKKPLNNAASRKQDIAAPKPPPPPPPPPTRKAQTPRGRPIGDIEVDAWEKAEMAKIKEKFDKLNSEIVSWADKKKKKAKRKLDKTEGALDQKRAKALRRYRTEIQNIDYVAGGAQAQAEEKRRNEELKVKEKAKIIRETGQFPKTCFCF